MPKRGKQIYEAREIQSILEAPAIILPELPAGEFLKRLHDDHDGECTGLLTLYQTEDGDMWVNVEGSPREILRFRTFLGGGASLRVHNALKILAEAIRLDNKERPQQLKPNPTDHVA